MEEAPPNKKRLVIYLSIAVSFILLLFIILWITLAKKKLPTLLPNQNNVGLEKTNQSAFPSSKGNPSPVPAPEVKFETYENIATMPAVPSSIGLYSLKNNFSSEEITAFAKKLGLTEKYQDTKQNNSNNSVYYSLTDKIKKGILIFNNLTGNFSFESYGLHTPPVLISGESPIATANSFLTYLFPNDSSLNCADTYQRKDYPENSVFVECHRNWKKVGAPILSSVGIVNVNEQILLSSLTLGKNSEALKDPTVINTSNNTNGLKRPADFNTATVEVDKNTGRIISVNSNIRWISKIQSLNSSNLISPQEAFKNLESHLSDFSLTIPAGAGSVSFDKVYRDGKAIAKKAVVTDFILSFVEKPSGVVQDFLSPTYIIRGTAELESGYTVRFVQTVPVTINSISFLSPREMAFNNDKGLARLSWPRGEASGGQARLPAPERSDGGQVAGASTQKYLAQTDSTASGPNDRGQKQGTFFISTPSPNPSLSPTDIITTPNNNPTNTPIQPTPTVNPLPTASCNTNGLTVIDLPGIGKVGYDAVQTRTYYYIPDPNTNLPISDLNSLRASLASLGITQMQISYAKTLELHNMIGQFNGKDFDQKDLARALADNINFGPNNGYQFFDINIVDFLTGVSQGMTTDQAKEQITNKNNNPKAKIILKDSFDQFLEQAKTGQLLALSSKIDIFPDETRVFFIALFADRQTNQPTLTTTDCPYLSGASPSIHLYPDAQTDVNIFGVNLPITYSYPSIDDQKSWHFTAFPNGKINSGRSQTDRIYYEYDKNKVNFTDEEKGFIVRKEDLTNFTQSIISPVLKLNTSETNDLINDIKNGLPTKNYPYYRLSIINREKLDIQLPIDISPKPDNYQRIFLLLNPLSFEEAQKGYTIQPPSLSPINRNGFTAVEVGVYYKGL